MGGLTGCAPGQKQLARGGPDSFSGGDIAAQPLVVKGSHELAGKRVVNRPKGHHDALCAGHAEGAFEAEHAFAIVEFAIAGVAGRQHSPLDAAQVKRGNLLGGDDGGLVFGIGAGEDQAGVQQWIAAAAAMVEQKGVGGNVEEPDISGLGEKALARGLLAREQLGLAAGAPVLPRAENTCGLLGGTGKRLKLEAVNGGAGF